MPLERKFADPAGLFPMEDLTVAAFMLLSPPIARQRLRCDIHTAASTSSKRTDFLHLNEDRAKIMNLTRRLLVSAAAFWIWVTPRLLALLLAMHAGQVHAGLVAFGDGGGGRVDTTGVLAGKRLTAVAAGANHFLVISADGQIFAWGASTRGQLGNGGSGDDQGGVAG